MALTTATATTTAARQSWQFGRIYTPDEAWLATAPPEPILDPDLPIVDPHHHLWLRGGHPYLLDELLADLNTGHNVVATVFEECHSMGRGGHRGRCGSDPGRPGRAGAAGTAARRWRPVPRRAPLGRLGRGPDHRQQPPRHRAASLPAVGFPRRSRATIRARPQLRRLALPPAAGRRGRSGAGISGDADHHGACRRGARLWTLCRQIGRDPARVEALDERTGAMPECRRQ